MSPTPPPSQPEISGTASLREKDSASESRLVNVQAVSRLVVRYLETKELINRLKRS